MRRADQFRSGSWTGTGSSGRDRTTSTIPTDLAPTLRDLVSQKTGRTWYYFQVPKYIGTTEGNLILSKYPLVSTSSRFLSYQRSVAQATINISGRTINFFATHLDPDSSGARVQQISELTAFAAGFSESR